VQALCGLELGIVDPRHTQTCSGQALTTPTWSGLPDRPRVRLSWAIQLGPVSAGRSVFDLLIWWTLCSISSGFTGLEIFRMRV
jgi:hypothetical protein